MSRIPVSRQNKFKKEARTRANADLNLSAAIPSTTDINAIIAQYLIDNPVGGSVQKLTDFTSGQVSSGASGSIVTQPAVAGKTFRIRHLTTSGAAVETGMTLTIDGVPVFSGQDLTDTTPAANVSSGIFGVSPHLSNSTLGDGARILPEITCSSFTLSKDTGTTLRNILYAYETLEDI